MRTNECISERIEVLGIPVVKPAEGHAVFVDARGWLAHIPPLAYPGQAVAVGLHEVAGIRACEIGTVMFGRAPDGSEHPAVMDLVRLPMPRRVCTQPTPATSSRPSPKSRRWRTGSPASASPGSRR